VLIVGGTLFFLLLFGFQILILRPISGLARAVAGISLKGQGARLKSRRKDEIGIVAREFDALLDRVQGTARANFDTGPRPTPPRDPKRPQEGGADRDEETLRRLRRLMQDDDS